MLDTLRGLVQRLLGLVDITLLNSLRGLLQILCRLWAGLLELLCLAIKFVGHALAFFGCHLS